jgi:hypothetical protein
VRETNYDGFSQDQGGLVLPGGGKQLFLFYKHHPTFLESAFPKEIHQKRHQHKGVQGVELVMVHVQDGRGVQFHYFKLVLQLLGRLVYDYVCYSQLQSFLRGDLLRCTKEHPFHDPHYCQV